MKTYNSAAFNMMALLCEQKSKLVPMAEVVLLVEEPNWVNDQKKKKFNKETKASEIRMMMSKDAAIKLRADLDLIIQNMENMQMICDSAKIQIVHPPEKTN